MLVAFFLRSQPAVKQDCDRLWLSKAHREADPFGIALQILVKQEKVQEAIALLIATSGQTGVRSLVLVKGDRATTTTQEKV